MLSREANLALFRRQARGADVAVVEGVMGLFDGYDGSSEAGSTAQMAKWLGLPVLLVVDARAMARSAAALVHGFASFDPDLSLAGVVFNRIGSPAHLEYLQQALTSLHRRARASGGCPGTGNWPSPSGTWAWPPPRTTPWTRPIWSTWRIGWRPTWTWTACWRPCRCWRCRRSRPRRPSPPTVRLGVARDRAFCFYYPENLELLASFGAELVPFSPLEDRELPAGLARHLPGRGLP